MSICDGCKYSKKCDYTHFYDDTKSERENIFKYCGNCICGNIIECNKDNISCPNFEEIEEIPLIHKILVEERRKKQKENL